MRSDAPSSITVILALLLAVSGCLGPKPSGTPNTFAPPAADGAAPESTAPTTPMTRPAPDPAVNPPATTAATVPTRAAPVVPTFHGRIVDEAGNAVEGAHVWLERAALRDVANTSRDYEALRAQTLTTSDASGKWAIPRVPGALRVALRDPDHVPQTLALPETGPVNATLAAWGPRSVTGHRGAAAYAPENTMAGLRVAWLLGLPVAEVDVRRTSDDVLVLMHDPLVDRTTDGQGAVASLSWDRVKELDAGTWFHATYAQERVPRLTDALRWASEHSQRVQLDVKGESADAVLTMQATIDLVRATDAANLVALSAFDEAAFAVCAAEAAAPCILVLDDDVRATAMVSPAGTHATYAVAMRAAFVTQERADLAQAWGVRLHAWTVNDAALAFALYDKGVASVTSDRPGPILDALSSLLVSKTPPERSSSMDDPGPPS